MMLWVFWSKGNKDMCLSQLLYFTISGPGNMEIRTCAYLSYYFLLYSGPRYVEIRTCAYLSYYLSIMTKAFSSGCPCQLRSFSGFRPG